MRTVSILIADNHGIVRRGLCSLLETQSAWKTAEAADGHEAVTKAITLLPDVVIMDISMPRLNGLQAARRIHKEIPKLPILLLSGDSANELVNEAMHAGVRGYVVKTDAAVNLVAAVHTLLQGKTFFTAAVSRRLLENICCLAKRETTVLTVRETEIIQLLCEGKSNKEVGRSPRIEPPHR